MDFVVGLLRTQRGNDVIQVIIDRLTKVARFIPIKNTQGAKQLADAYVKKIVRVHGVPRTIVSYREPKFLSRFWEKLQETFGNKFCLSTNFHPSTDGKTETTIQILENLLRCSVLDFGGSWKDKLPMVEFSYNNNFESGIKIYGTKRCPVWKEVLSTYHLFQKSLITKTKYVKIIKSQVNKKLQLSP